MRSIFLAGLSATIARHAFGALPTDRERTNADYMAVDRAFKRRSKTAPARHSDATEDPYFQIATRGRRGAHKAFRLQQLAFAKTKVAERNARGRELSNPMKHPARRTMFDKALAELQRNFPSMPVAVARDQARRSARAVPVPSKRRAG